MDSLVKVSRKIIVARRLKELDEILKQP